MIFRLLPAPPDKVRKQGRLRYWIVRFRSRSYAAPASDLLPLRRSKSASNSLSLASIT